MTKEQCRALQWAVCHSGFNSIHKVPLLELLAAGASSEGAAGASEDDARDAARYRAKRTFAVSMGITENNDDYDKYSDSMVAAIAKESGND